MSGLASDIRLALRGWGRDPWASGAAIASLALGIAAVTVVFTVTNAALFRSIPGTTAEGLVRVQGAGQGDGTLVLSGPELVALRARPDLFSSLTAERINSLALRLDDQAVSVGGAAVTTDYFRTLGVGMALGAGFPPGPVTRPAAVVSYGFWRSALAGDPDAVGRRLRAGGLEFTVVGVAAEGFVGAFPGFRASIWVPLEHVEAVFPGDGSPDRMDDRFLNVLATLAPGQDPAGVEQRLEVLASGLAERDPDFPATRTFRVAPATGVHPSLKPIAGTILGAILLVVSTVLLIACANVASLLLARAIRRRSETAARVALGAGRARLIRQALTESVVLGLMGSMAGILLAWIIVRALVAAQAGIDLPVGLRLAIDVRALGIAAAAGLGCGLVFGIVPAVRAAGRDVAPDLRAGAQSVGRRASWLENGLVVLQVAVTVALLVSAGLLVRSVERVATLDPGFERDGIVTVEADIGARSEPEGRAYWEAVRAAALATQGVDRAALGLFVHLGGRADQLRVATSDSDVGAALGPINYSIVEGGLADLLGVPMVSGRNFPTRIGPDDAPVAIVNEVLAERLWPSGTAVGRSVTVTDVGGEDRTVDIIGVSRSVKYRRLNEGPTPFLYLPYAQWYRPDMVLHLRARGEPSDILESVRRRLAAIDADVPVTVRRMTDHETVSVLLARVLRFVLLACGVAGLAIASVGVFGVVAHRTERRVREMAIRTALGATVARVRAMVVVDSLSIVGLGLGLGLLVTRITGRALGALLYGVTDADPATLVTVAGLVVGVATFASWLPARRATARLEVAEALRND